MSFCVGKMKEDFYNSRAWQHKRKWILKRDGYRDQIAKRYGKAIDATIVHHIFPADEYPEYRLCDWNLISVSLATHNALHNRDDHTLTAEGVALMNRTRRYEREYRETKAKDNNGNS